MTGTVALPLPVPGSGRDGRQRRDRLELLSALISGPGFDPLLRGDIIEFPRDHPVFWWGCRITGCERPRRENKMLCSGHESQWQQERPAGADRAAWMRDAAPLGLPHARVPQHCRVCGHRPAIRGASRLCARHQQRWKKARRKAGSPRVEEWLAAQVPYDSFGGCRVAVCPEPRIRRWACATGTSRPTASRDARAGPGCPARGSAGSSRQARLSRSATTTSARSASGARRRCRCRAPGRSTCAG